MIYKTQQMSEIPISYKHYRLRTLLLCYYKVCFMSMLHTIIKKHKNTYESNRTTPTSI